MSLRVSDGMPDALKGKGMWAPQKPTSTGGARGDIRNLLFILDLQSLEVTMGVDLRHDAERSRFVAETDGRASVLEYADQGNQVLEYQSTFVPPELRRRGIASDLVKFALDYARENSYRIVPTCWFVRQFIDNNPEYRDLVAR
jgi:hypothetical protein